MKILLSVAIVIASSLNFAVAADNYPDKPIRLVNPFAPGGTTEIIARTIRTELGKNMGQQWILDSKPGDGGNLAMKEVLRSEQVRWSEVLQKANIKPE